MIVTRFAILGVPVTKPPNLNHRYAIAQEGGQCDLFRLKGGVRELNPEGDAESFASGCVESERPNRIEIQSSGTRLYVAPIAANVKNIHKRQIGNLFDVLFERFAPGSRRKRGTTFFPAVSHQPQSRIAQRFF